MSTGETISDDPLEHIRATAIGLLLDLDVKDGGSGNGLNSRHVTYMLPGESIGEGETFFVVDCEYSKLGLVVSMGHYSDLETVESEPEHPSTQMLREFGLPQPERAREEDSPLVLVSFFDINQDYINGVGKIHATDTEANDEELAHLMKIMVHPDLEPLTLSDEHDEKYNWTSLHQMQGRVEATHAAFLRIAGDNPIAVQWADRYFLGIKGNPDDKLSDTAPKKERVLPTIARWLAKKLRET